MFRANLGTKRADNIIDSILDGWRRGATGPLPQITSLQLLHALVLIEREGPLGRRALAQALQIRDGVARGLVERLAESKIVKVRESGVELSVSGKQDLHKYLRQLAIKKILPLPESSLIPEHQALGIHLLGAYSEGMTGVAQRDEAIKAGSRGANTKADVKGKLVIPPDNKRLSTLAPADNDRLQKEFEPSHKDLIIIGFGKGESSALAGALAAVLSLQ